MTPTKTTAELFVDSLTEFIKDRKINVYRISAISGDGKTVDVTLNDCNPCQNSYSISKFFTLTAIGLLWDDGLIELDEKLTDIFAELCPSNRKLRVLMLDLRLFFPLYFGYCIQLFLDLFTIVCYNK